MTNQTHISSNINFEQNLNLIGWVEERLCDENPQGPFFSEFKRKKE